MDNCATELTRLYLIDRYRMMQKANSMYIRVDLVYGSKIEDSVSHPGIAFLSCSPLLLGPNSKSCGWHQPRFCEKRSEVGGSTEEMTDLVSLC